MKISFNGSRIIGFNGFGEEVEYSIASLCIRKTVY